MAPTTKSRGGRRPHAETQLRTRAKDRLPRCRPSREAGEGQEKARMEQRMAWPWRREVDDDDSLALTGAPQKVMCQSASLPVVSAAQ